MSNSQKQEVISRAAPLPEIFQRYAHALDEELRSGLSKGGLQVYDMLRYYMGWVDENGSPHLAAQGKLLRPTLCLLSCEAVGGEVTHAIPAAVALEFIHNFSLIHDDIQDHDRTRHHRLTLWAVWGIPKALVAGNVLRIIADSSLENLLDRGVKIQQALLSVSLLAEAYLQMIEGQYLDISFEGQHDIGMDEYLGMISRKTGALIQCAVSLGAVIGTPDSETVEAFRSFGQSIGYAFQIRDDYLGVWGEEEATGKPVGADIKRKKNSFPVVHAMSQAKGKDKELLLHTYQKDELADADVDIVLDIMDRANTKSTAEELTAGHCEQALRALDGVELAPRVRSEIEELVEFLLVRQH